MYAEVIIDIKNKEVDRPFTYRIPEDLAGQISVGSSVDVPFGRGNSIRTGYVMSLKRLPFRKTGSRILQASQKRLPMSTTGC